MNNNTLSLNPTRRKSGAISQKPAQKRSRPNEVVVTATTQKRFNPQKPPLRAPRKIQPDPQPVADVRDSNLAQEQRKKQALLDAQERERIEAERHRIETLREAEAAKVRAAQEAIDRAAAEPVSGDPAEVSAPTATATAVAEQPPKPAASPKSAPGRKIERKRGRDRDAAEQKQPAKQFANRRSRGKLSLNNALEDDGIQQRQRSHAAWVRSQERKKRKAAATEQSYEKIVRDVQLPESIIVQELANRMAERVTDVLKTLLKNGVIVNQNQFIDADTAEVIIGEFGHKAVRVSDADVEDVIETVEDRPEDVEPRPAVVSVMGHVDHGKTSLLDAIRNTRVVDGEAGGITQHIGAYQVQLESGQKVTFLDTPGHAAFTAMRARGAHVTDVVILVVAADDSVMPQTVEAINHAKAADVPVIVAINKCDVDGADPENVRNQLLRHGIVVEKRSGEVLDVEVSAATGQGIPALLDAIVLQAEILELKANPNRAAEGAVVEAKLTSGMGPVATVLVRRGTLQVGNHFVVGEQHGKVRAMFDENRNSVGLAGPSAPVEVLGLKGTPLAGDVLNVVENENQAREISAYRQSVSKKGRSTAGVVASLEQLKNIRDGKSEANAEEVRLVVKADVQGSAEAIVQAVEKIGNDEVRVRVLHSGVGAISETDISLAEASNAIVIGFNVRPDAPAQTMALRKGIEIRDYRIIYDLINDIRKLASNLLEADVKETRIGMAEVLEIFRITGVGMVAGCRVTDGAVRKAAGVRLLRDSIVVHEGRLKTLKRFKDEVPEVRGGQECGMAIENYGDVKPGDQIEIFERQEIQRSL